MSGVGSEEVDFEPAIPLEGKVEIYMQVIIAVQATRLRGLFLELSLCSTTTWFQHLEHGRIRD